MTSNADPIIQRDFSSGITIDKYAPIRSSFAGGKGVDIFSPSKVVLSTHNQNNIITLPNNSYPTTIGDIIASQNGYIYDTDGTMIYDISNVDGYSNVRNYADFTINNVDYRVLVTTKFLHRYTPNELYTYTDLAGSGTNWSFSGLDLVHTPGSTVVFTGSAPAVIGKQYVLDFDVNTLTAGSFTITIGNDTAVNITANGNYKLNFKANTTAGVIITPTSTYDGSITGLNMIGASTMTEGFEELTNISNLAPILVDQGDMYIGNGNIVAVLDNNGVLFDALVLPKGKEIVGLTRDENYIVIWTRGDKDSTIYFWDGISDIALSSKLWKNDILQSIEDQGDYIYAVTGSNTQTRKIWKTNGYSRALVYSIPFGNWYSGNGNNSGILPSLPLHFYKIDTKGNNITTNDMSSFGEMVFLPSKTSVLVYGRKNPSLPFAMVNQYPLVDCGGIYSIYAENEEIVIGYEDLSIGDARIVRYKIDNQDTVSSTTDDYNYGSTGHIELLPISGLISQINHGISVELGYKTPTDTYMNVLYRINGEKDMFTFVSLSSGITILPTVGSVYEINSNSLTVTKVKEFGDYTYIEFNRTAGDYITFNNDFITKDSGTGDTNIDFVRMYNYRYLDNVNSSNEIDERKRVRKVPETFAEIEFAIELNTDNGSVTPEFNDIILYRDIKPNG